ncbi:unnamed protein product [Cuscuta epithymum]|uniref:Uncharacterized protein n=1 Tax=Cuscuta epithymum TaxID=186058 RepID=A0AAV0E1B5_9ASTE|nr:unnamed protein product [Cuscuta epithymum]
MLFDLNNTYLYEFPDSELILAEPLICRSISVRYSGIDRKDKDLLTMDYVSDQKLSVSTCSESAMALTSTPLKRELTQPEMWQHNTDVTVDVKVDTKSNISLTLTLANILPSIKAIASPKFPDYNSVKLDFEYFHHYATLAAAVSALKQSPKVDLAITFGTSTFVVGAEAGYETSFGKLIKTALEQT